MMQLLSRCKDLPWPNQRNSNELQAELYNEVGLPAYLVIVIDTSALLAILKVEPEA